MTIFLQLFQDAIKENLDKQIIVDVNCIENEMVLFMLKQSWAWKLAVRSIFTSKATAVLDKKEKELRKKYGYKIEPKIRPFWWNTKPDIELDIGV